MKNKAYLIKSIPYLLILMIGMVAGRFLLSTPNEVDKKVVDEEKNELKFICSMHPHIESIEEGSCPLCGMSLVRDETLEQSISDTAFKLSNHALALANISTMTIEANSQFEYYIDLYGVVTTNGRTNAFQTTLFDGRLEEFFVNSIGERIVKGQRIGTIYSPELYAAQDKLITSASYKDSHKKLFDAARNTLGLWKLSDEQIDHLLKSGKPESMFPLFADVSGTVTDLFALKGGYYNQGDPLFKVSNLDEVWLVFDAYEDIIGSLKIGQHIQISVNEGDLKLLDSKIELIEPIMDPNSRTFAVRTSIANKYGALNPGMFVSGKVRIKMKSGGIVIPKTSILWTGKRSLVYLKPFVDQPIFEMREITLGKELGDHYEVLEGLGPGEEIVINGVFTIDAAAQLAGKPSMMNYKIKNIKLKD